MILLVKNVNKLVNKSKESNLEMVNRRGIKIILEKA